MNNDDIIEWDDDRINEARRKRLAKYAQLGAACGPNLGKMCGTCAFKLDSPANMEPHNTDAAEQCLGYYGTFQCHKEIGVSAGTPCIGFLYAKQYFDKTFGHEKNIPDNPAAAVIDGGTGTARAADVRPGEGLQ